MISFKPGKVLLVAPDVFRGDLLASSQVIHVTDISRIFPSIFQVMPKSILFDYDYLGRDVEKLLRRLQGNPFYHKIKIYCYKADANAATDDLLKALGVQQVFLKDDLKQAKQNKAAVNQLKTFFDRAVVNLLLSAAI